MLRAGCCDSGSVRGSKFNGRHGPSRQVGKPYWPGVAAYVVIPSSPPVSALASALARICVYYIP